MSGVGAPIRKISQKPGKTNFPVRTPSPEWDQAVCTAAARLNEGWILPETRCHPAVVEELAATLCAYAA